MQFNKIKNYSVAVAEFGGKVLAKVILPDGKLDNEIVEIRVMDRSFLTSINSCLGTRFTLSDFEYKTIGGTHNV